MVLNAKDWGMEDTKKWFEGVCRYGLTMGEQTWDLVIVPLFNEIARIQAEATEATAKLKYTNQEVEKYMKWRKEDTDTILKLKEKVAMLEAQKAALEKKPKIVIANPSSPNFPKTPWDTFKPMFPSDVYCDAAPGMYIAQVDPSRPIDKILSDIRDEVVKEIGENMAGKKDCEQKDKSND